MPPRARRRMGQDASGFAQFYTSRAQVLSHGVASESNPRREPWDVAQWMRSPGRGDRNKAGTSFAAPRLLPFNVAPPRLAPWATFWRCSAANGFDSAPSNGDAPHRAERF